MAKLVIKGKSSTKKSVNPGMANLPK